MHGQNHIKFLMKIYLHHFVSQVQICSSSILYDTEILPARILFCLLMFSTSCFTFLYILHYFLCDPGFLSFGPLKILHAREV